MNVIFRVCIKSLYIFVFAAFLSASAGIYADTTAVSSDTNVSRAEEITSFFSVKYSLSDETPDIIVLEKPQFTVFYNSAKLIPEFVLWHLENSDLGAEGRSNDFRPDFQLPENLYRVKKRDYQYTRYGFDRGHVCPSADRTDTKENNSATFLMTNMIPQSPDLNRIVWKDLEAYERELAVQGNELYIIAGQFGLGGTGATGTFLEIPVEQTGAPESFSIAVPAYCWKIILLLPPGENDLQRVTSETPVISVCMPNEQGLQQRGSWTAYLCSVDYIEEQCGWDFFTALDDEIENEIESRIYKVQ